MKFNWILFLWITITGPIIMHGCATPEVSPMPVEPPAGNQKVLPDYYLQPGDNLDIKFFYNPELNENVTIRPDGKISLQLVDEVAAAGLTPKDLDDVLTKKYKGQLKEPIIAVIVKTFEGQRIYVGGEVTTPQVLTVVGRINALQAVFNAGGFTPDAKLSSTIIVRKGPDNRPIIRIVDLEQALMGTLAEEAYTLMPYDMVYVPKTSVAKMDEFLTHIYNFIPRNIGLGFTYELHAADNND